MTLTELLQKAALHKMTPAEIKEQRISFVYGQLMDCAPDITKEQVRQLDDEIYGKVKD